MGQRSQIYVRIFDKNNNTTLIAKYFGWNYSERMISRARYGIDYIKKSMKYLDDISVKNKINRILDVNFDMIDIQETGDILEELRDEFSENRTTNNSFIFQEQHNNNGKLFIDCNQNTNEIKFCFTDNDLNLFSAEEYLNWDVNENWDSPNCYEDERTNKEWQEILPTCKENIKFINENAKLMTKEELQEFLEADYSKQIGDSTFLKLLRNFIEKGMTREQYWLFNIERVSNDGSWKMYDKTSKDLLFYFDNTNKGLQKGPYYNEFYSGLFEDIQQYYIKEQQKEITTNTLNNDDVDYDY